MLFNRKIKTKLPLLIANESTDSDAGTMHKARVKHSVDKKRKAVNFRIAIGDESLFNGDQIFCKTDVKTDAKLLAFRCY